MFNSGDRLTLVGSTISGNSASGLSQNGQGGGLWLASNTLAPLTILDTEISGNTAMNYGGGLYFRTLFQIPGNDFLTLTNVTISGNTARRGGGVATGSGSQGVITGSLMTNGGSISGNTAAFEGGGVYSRASTLTVNGTTISGNRAGGNGGGIATPQSGVQAMQMSFVGAAIRNNAAGVDGVGGEGPGDGGGLWIPASTVPLTLLSTEVSNNVARRGGGIYRGNQIVEMPGPSLIAVDSTISGNPAEDRGGGVYNVGGSLSFTHTAITGNTAAGRTLDTAAVSSNRDADVSLVNSSLSGNTSVNARGGGLYLSARRRLDCFRQHDRRQLRTDGRRWRSDTFAVTMTARPSIPALFPAIRLSKALAGSRSVDLRRSGTARLRETPVAAVRLRPVACLPVPVQSSSSSTTRSSRATGQNDPVHPISEFSVRWRHRAVQPDWRQPRHDARRSARRFARRQRQSHWQAGVGGRQRCDQSALGPAGEQRRANAKRTPSCQAARRSTQARSSPVRRWDTISAAIRSAAWSTAPATASFASTSARTNRKACRASRPATTTATASSTRLDYIRWRNTLHSMPCPLQAPTATATE